MAAFFFLQKKKKNHNKKIKPIEFAFPQILTFYFAIHKMKRESQTTTNKQILKLFLWMMNM